MRDVGPLTMTSCSASPLFDSRIPATDHDVRDVLLELRGLLSQRGLSKEELSSIEIVLAEAMNNIVEHAYADAEGEISLCLTEASDGLKVRLLDDGCAMPEGAMPLGRTYQENTSFNDLPEGGFGWFLIRELARDLTYRRLKDQNALDFRFAVTLPETVN